MSTKKNTLNSPDHHVHSETNSPGYPKQFLRAADHFIKVYNSRAAFFSDDFIKKVKKADRKALAELQRFALPPTQMDLRQDFAFCLQAKITDDYVFAMGDGKRYTMAQLKYHVPEWALLAEKILIESDPALADKLMTPLQWNAKAAFEVTFASAMNELKDIKKTKVISSADHYMKWIISPLKKAIEQAKSVKPPGNSLIGYGDRIPLKEALAIAETLPDEFDRIIKSRKE